MKQSARIPVLLLAACWLFGLGCRTANVNPPSPRPHTGYIDFYTDSDLVLSWEVKQWNDRAGKMEKVFSEFAPVTGNTLRLQAAPGNQRFQIWFINRATEGPLPVSLEVQDGKITPVHVGLLQVASALSDTKIYGSRPAARGYGRGVKITTEKEEVYRIEATPQPVLDYQPKERMSYWRVEPAP